MKKILLIEDNAEFRENTTEILQMANYKVFVAENGIKGIKVIKKESPDLIICDIMMPDLDGYGVLHVINKDPEYSGIPFIFLSAKNDHGDIRKGMELGADDFLRKPVHGEELLQAVETRLKKSEMLKARFISNKKDSNNSLPDKSDLSLINFLSAERETKRYGKRQIVYNKGNRLGALYYIITGKVKTFKVTEDGNELITDILKEGDFLGYNALLEGSEYTDNAETLEDTELKLIPKEDFLSLMYNNNKIANQFVRLLTKSVVEKEEQLLKLAYHSLRKRVADGILYLQDKYRSSANDKTKFKISRQNLANVTGAAKESVIRTLSDFKNEKMIDIKEGNIIVLKEDKLRQLFN